MASGCLQQPPVLQGVSGGPQTPLSTRLLSELGEGGREGGKVSCPSLPQELLQGRHKSKDSGHCGVLVDLGPQWQIGLPELGVRTIS